MQVLIGRRPGDVKNIKHAMCTQLVAFRYFGLVGFTSDVPNDQGQVCSFYFELLFINLYAYGGEVFVREFLVYEPVLL